MILISESLDYFLIKNKTKSFIKQEFFHYNDTSPMSV
jgi:hypothetical protein